MSKFKVGQLVMLVGAVPGSLVPNGAFGEILDSLTYPSVGVDKEVVLYPRFLSDYGRGEWQTTSAHLIPISDPDIDVDSHEGAHQGDVVRVGENV